mgnify:CR=1 FL=1
MSDKLIDFESKTKPLTNGNYYWTFEKALDSKTCNLILDTASNHFSKVTVMEENGDLVAPDKHVRKGHNFFDNKQFIYDTIWPFMTTANENAEWNFEISSAESYQIGKYEVDDFYQEHVDSLGTEGTVFKDPKNSNLDKSFNSISVDGDTSTNDTLILFSLFDKNQEQINQHKKFM